MSRNFVGSGFVLFLAGNYGVLMVVLNVEPEDTELSSDEVDELKRRLKKIEKGGSKLYPAEEILKELND